VLLANTTSLHHATLCGQMLGRTYEGQNCSVAKALELVGERWTVLILREVFFGRRRFDEMADNLQIARNVLTARLGRLTEEGVLEKVAYQERPERFEYRLTEKGLDLWPVLVTLMQFGDRYYAPAGPPIVLTHRDCGGTVDEHRICAQCGARLGPKDVRAHQGSGALSPEAPAPASALARTGHP
jgi:DNA-binding HxlR family transcriptional regulator